MVGDFHLVIVQSINVVQGRCSKDQILANEIWLWSGGVWFKFHPTTLDLTARISQSHYWAGKSQDVRVAMVAPKYCQIKIVDRKCMKMSYLQTRDADNRDAMKKHKMSVHMSWLTLSTRSKNKNPPKPWTMNQINISSISSQPSHCLTTFSPANPRPRPRQSSFCASTAALASRSHWTINSWPFEAAQCSGVAPREPRPCGPRPQAEPNGTKGRKTLRKIWHLKYRIFGNCGYSKTSLDLRNIVTLWVWDLLRGSSSWFIYTHVAFEHSIEAVSPCW